MTDQTPRLPAEYDRAGVHVMSGDSIEILYIVVMTTVVFVLTLWRSRR